MLSSLALIYGYSVDYTNLGNRSKWTFYQNKNIISSFCAYKTACEEEITISISLLSDNHEDDVISLGEIIINNSTGMLAFYNWGLFLGDKHYHRTFDSMQTFLAQLQNYIIEYCESI